MKKRKNVNNGEIRISINLTISTSPRNRGRWANGGTSLFDIFSNWDKTTMNVDPDDPDYDDTLPFQYHPIREEEE